MTNYLVIPDLYEGSALTTISDKIRKEISTEGLHIQIVDFREDFTLIKSGVLDDPDIFFDHNLYVLKTLKDILKDGDRVLFIDFFQPGLELLFYYLASTSKKIRIGSLFHGASFVPHDFFNKFKWMENFDKGLIDLMDRIYVSSKSVKNLFLNSSNVKYFSYGFNPTEFECDLKAKKEYDVIIPHRWSWEKNPLFYKQLILEMPEIVFAISGFGEFSEDKKLKELFSEIVSRDNVVNLGIKPYKEHLEDLSRAKVVLGTQDLFGYSIREAISSGCIPLCINNFVYPEFLEETYLFNNLEEAKKKLYKFIKDYPLDYKNIPETKFKPILEDFYGS
jgi:hypothetical protein